MKIGFLMSRSPQAEYDQREEGFRWVPRLPGEQTRSIMISRYVVGIVQIYKITYHWICCDRRNFAVAERDDVPQ